MPLRIPLTRRGRLGQMDERRPSAHEAGDDRERHDDHEDRDGDPTAEGRRHRTASGTGSETGVGTVRILSRGRRWVS